MSSEPTAEQIRDVVRGRYAEAARQAQRQGSSGCCSGSAPSQTQLYQVAQLQEVPETAALASLGCGNPTLLAQLKEGETVLDLGSGGGIDVLLSARRVGPTGKAYGLDMTDEILALARENAGKAGVTNVEFLKGQIESIPLPDASVDVIISNCVINLSADKDAVLSEAFRVLKPGGRFAVADIVVRGGPLPAPVRRMMSLWVGCIAGALGEDEYRAKLAKSGFGGIDLEVLKEYDLEDVPEDMRSCIPSDLSLPDGTKIVSAFIRATKGGGSEGTGGSRPVTIRKGSESSVKPAASGCCGGTASAPAARSKAAASDEVKSYFREVAPHWDQMRQGYFTEEVRDAAIARANLGPDSVVADVGTGTGFMLVGVAPRVRQAYGFDNSPEMLEVARANLSGQANVELRLSDGSSLPLGDGTVDTVFANMYLHHAPDPSAAIREAARLLRSGGRLVITDVDQHQEEWMRTEMADLWLGFDREQVAGWFRTAGLTEVQVECAQST